MSIAELGALGEFVGAIAVLVTLVYLVFQIKQNTRSIRSQSRYYVLEAVTSDMRTVQTPEYWDVARKINSGNASRADRIKWSMILSSWFSHQEMLYWEVVNGTLPKTFEPTLQFRVAGTLMHPNVREVWNAWRGIHISEFQAYVDDLFEKDLSEIVGVRKLRSMAIRAHSLRTWADLLNPPPDVVALPSLPAERLNEFPACECTGAMPGMLRSDRRNRS